MKDNTRELTLKIEAGSHKDLAALLRMALFELEKTLPLLKEPTLEDRSAAAVQAFTAKNQIAERLVTAGSTLGTVGAYSFEYLHCSRQFYELEKSLKAQGYEVGEGQGFFGVEYYIHPKLPAKIIKGNPPQILDYTPEE